MKRKYAGRKPGSTSVKDEERENILVDYKAGMTLKAMIAKYKRSKTTIVSVARKAGLGKRDQHAVRKQSQALTGGTAIEAAPKSKGKKKGKKKSKAKIKDSVARANDALASANKGNGAIKRAVAAFVEALEDEDLLEITVNVHDKTYTLYRIQFEDGSV